MGVRSSTCTRLFTVHPLATNCEGSAREFFFGISADREEADSAVKNFLPLSLVPPGVMHRTAGMHLLLGSISSQRTHSILFVRYFFRLRNYAEPGHPGNNRLVMWHHLDPCGCSSCLGLSTKMGCPRKASNLAVHHNLPETARKAVRFTVQTQVHEQIDMGSSGKVRTFSQPQVQGT